MSDVLKILGLKFTARHGVLPEEKTLLQPFEVDVEIIRDLSAPSVTDKLDDTVDYSRVISLVREAVNGGHCSLIEKLAGRIVERLSEILDNCDVVVRVRKPRAPVDIQFNTVEVELRRTIHH